MQKVYKCCICHKILDEKPIRIVKQEYAVGRYNQYGYVDKYDICKKCYISFDRWINKHKEK